MEVLFLGTSGAWGLPEHSCPCSTCAHLRAMGEHRTRTSLWLDGPARVLVDPGPDLRAQLMRENLPRPDAVLISHEHGDHFLGLDELLCFRRAVSPRDWRPIPVYASKDAWSMVEPRFGYLLGSLLEKRLVEPGGYLEGDPFGRGFACRAVKTYHGPVPKGSVGYVFEHEGENGRISLGYTSDMASLPDPKGFAGMNSLICQCHFLNEPKVNRANHLSLQKALPLLESWNPARVYFCHVSCQDFIPGDGKLNLMLKKYEPENPLAGPGGAPYPIPRDQASWQALLERVFADRGLPIRPRMAQDGLRIRVSPGQ